MYELSDVVLLPFTQMCTRANVDAKPPGGLYLCSAWFYFKAPCGVPKKGGLIGWKVLFNVEV